MRPSSAANVLAVLLPILSWIGTTEANIVFASIPTVNAIKPGGNITVTWTMGPAPNGTALDNGNFDLQLRALTGQRYAIRSNVAQNLLSLSVDIPKNATGGMHSFYADYTGAGKMVSSNQFTISGAVVTTTLPPPPATSTQPATATGTGTSPGSGADGGMSGGAIGGIIIGVVAALLMIAFIFFCRHRRRTGTPHVESRSMGGDGDSKGRHQDKESLTRSAGPVDGAAMGRMAAPMGAPGPAPGTGSRLYRQDENGGGGPRSIQNQHVSPQQQQFQQPPPPQQQQQLQQQQQQVSRNPFDNAERVGAGSPGGASPPRQQQPFTYQPPQYGSQPGSFSPNGSTPPPASHQNNPFAGSPNPMMPGPPLQQQQMARNQSPYGAVPAVSHRDSFASELESVYDPRMMSMSGPSPLHQQHTNLTHTPSGQSIRHVPQTRSNLSPQPVQQQQQQQHNLNPFAEQDRESMALAAAVAAAAASPVLTQRQKHQQQVESRSQSPATNMNSNVRGKEIEMQPLDIQQHHFERPQQGQTAGSVNHRYDDKEELDEDEDDDDDEEDNVRRQYGGQTQQQQQQQQQQLPLQHQQQQPAQSDEQASGSAYTGYRDTIFGAYAQNQYDDDEDDDEVTTAAKQVPILSPSAPVPATQYQPQTSGGQKGGDPLMSGGAVVQRKKSVKFTSGPAAGPVVLPSHEAARELQMRQQQQQSKESLNAQPHKHNYEPEVEDEEEEEEEEDEDEDDIRSRMMETEAAAVQTQQRNNNPFNPPAPSQNSPSLTNVSTFGNGFYEDVLAAVDKKGVVSPTSPSHSTASGSTLPMSPLSATSSSTATVTSNTYVRPPMPKVPGSAPATPQPSAAPTVAHQYTVQTQNLPAPQPQQLQQPLAQEVYGAPSPRITPAAKTVMSH